MMVDVTASRRKSVMRKVYVLAVSEDMILGQRQSVAEMSEWRPAGQPRLSNVYHSHHVP